MKKKLLPNSGEVDEDFDSMKGKRKKERMRRAVQDCSDGKKDLCEKAAGDDLKLELDVGEKELAMVKLQAAPMIAADEIVACEEGLNLFSREKLASIDGDCLALGKKLFKSAGGTEADFNRWKERIQSLAKSKFEGTESNIKINKKRVDTLFEFKAKNGACDNKTVNEARIGIGKAAKKGDTAGEGKTVIKSIGVDSSKVKCRVIFQTQVTEGKHKAAAAAINGARNIGVKSGSKKRLRSLEENSGSSVSSSPTEEEVAYGSESEETDFSEGGWDSYEEVDSPDSSGSSDQGDDSLTAPQSLNSWGESCARPSTIMAIVMAIATATVFW